MASPLVVLHVLPDLAVGGGQVLLLRHIGAASTHMRHHVAFVQDKRDMLAKFEAAGAQWHYVPNEGGLGFVSCGRELGRIAWEIGASVIHTNNTGLDRRPGMLAAIHADVPLVNTLHAEGASRARSGGSGLQWLVKRFVRWREDRLAKRVTRGVIAVSNHVLASWQWRLDQIGIPASRCRVIHPGLDLHAFDETTRAGDGALRRQLLRGREGPLLVHVGRVAEGKGHRDLVPVVQRLLPEFPGVVMLCVGDGPEVGAVEAEAREAGVGEAFHFAKDRADVPAILNVCDLMLFPSHSEGFGLAPLEAMAASVPVVSNQLPSVEEFLGDGGVLVSIGDAETMAKAAADALRDRQRLAAMGHAGRRIVEQGFTVERFVQQHEALYASVAEAHAGRSRG